MLQQFICSGVLLKRELRMGSYGEEWFSTEQPFWHLVTADDERDAEEKLRKHYKNKTKDQEYYLQYVLNDIVVWEHIL